ncbi:MAG TPA: TonB family protein [Candidatus Sulfotelmatobacter sp.]|nr:TonB family protein [Candidatus Sulfotelmatobacter sp.]
MVPPLYPPLAREARIMGDVEVKLAIRRDGSVVSAEVISGHPMLKPAALLSAQKSTFSCNPGCTDDVTTFVMTYTFGMRENGSCSAPRWIHPRSKRCLYLWRCGGDWINVASDPAAVGSSLNRIIVLASAACVEWNSASTRP